MMRALTASLVAMAAASMAFASNWMPLAKFTDGTALLVDTASIASQHKYRTGWFKLISMQPADLPEDAIPSTEVPPGQKFKYIVELFYAKCARRTVAVIQGNFYGADDSLLGSIPVTTVRHARFEEVPPGGAGDKIVASLCKAQ